MHHPAADFMSCQQQALRERLARLPSDSAPPFDFAELQRRGAARAPAPAPVSGRLPPLRLGALAAACSAVLLGASLWRTPAPLLPVAPPRTSPDAEPALVRVATRAAVGELEDRIAWVDELLSESRLQGVHGEHLAALEHNRSQLMASLLTVRRADRLMNP